jgi:hypothetical protein
MNITAIILTRNEEAVIGDCLASVSFCNEIIVIDTGSTDKTIALAQEKNAKIFTDNSTDFSAKRNLGLAKATGDWVLYVDADERISDPLRDEILLQMQHPESTTHAFRVKRKNYYLGNHAWPSVERMERLFRKSALKGWQGALHESPVVEGQIGELEGYLIHYTHRGLSQMVTKTNTWSETEALLRLQAQHPLMSWWRFPRVMIGAFFHSYIRQGGWKVGTAGLIESMYQAFSAFITYAKLWELQQAGSAAPKHEK